MDKIEHLNVSVNDLLFFYRRHNLTDYLKLLKDDELLMARDNIVVDRIDEEKGAILDTINQELEYRADRAIQDENNISKKR